MNKGRIALAKRISEEQIKICSRPSFRGYIDRVLFNLLDKYDMSLIEFQDCYRVVLEDVKA